MLDILPVGERIKRARIINNFTLKQVCTNIISVSKLSCIENNKILPDKKTIEYLSEIFKVSPSYFSDSVQEQLLKNIDELLKMKSNGKSIDSLIEENISMSLKYNLYNECAKLIDLSFDSINNINVNSMEDSVYLYGNIINKCSDKHSIIKYYFNMQKYHFFRCDYDHSLINNEILLLEIDSNPEFKDIYFYSIYYLCCALIELKKYSSLEKYIKFDTFNLDTFHDENAKSKLYEIITYSLLYSNNLTDFNRNYNDIINNVYNNSMDKCNNFKLHCALIYCGKNEFSKASEIVNSFISNNCTNLNEDDLSLLIDFISSCINKNKFDLAEKMIDVAVNNSILHTNNVLIDKSYYCKFRLLLQKGELEYSKIYLSLSTDCLLKYARKRDLLERYLSISRIYKQFNHYSNSLEYMLRAKDIIDSFKLKPFFTSFIN